MSNPVWPGTLPAIPLQAGFSQQLANTVVRTDMDAGPAKMRRRFSAGVMPVSCAMCLTSAQKTTLINFYDNTLGGGALAFDWTDQLNTGTVAFRFTEPPSFSPYADKWDVSLSLEILP